jgi:hypothetical protein
MTEDKRARQLNLAEPETIRLPINNLREQENEKTASRDGTSRAYEYGGER